MRALAAAVLTLLVAAAPAADARWRAPLDGAVTGAYRYSPRTPYAAGQRRGVDLAGPPGAPVGAACGGRVTYAGRVPGRGLGVSVRCGALVATHLGLGTLAVRRGARVVPGTRVGTLGAAGRLRLGARVAGRRLRYVDPLTLIEDDPAQPPAVPLPPLGPAPRAAPAPPSPPRALPHPAAPRAPGPAGRARPVPPLAWAGLALLAAGLPVGGLVRRTRRGRRRAERRARARRIATRM